MYKLFQKVCAFPQFFVAFVIKVSACAAINVIRMIKMFGWESRMTERIAEKRAEELSYLRVSKILEVANNTIT